MLSELLDFRKLGLGVLWVFFVTSIWNIYLFGGRETLYVHNAFGHCHTFIE